MSAFIQTKNSEFLVLTDYYNDETILLSLDIVTSILKASQGGSVLCAKMPFFKLNKVCKYFVKEEIEDIIKMLNKKEQE